MFHPFHRKTNVTTTRVLGITQPGTRTERARREGAAHLAEHFYTQNPKRKNPLFTEHADSQTRRAKNESPEEQRKAVKQSEISQRRIKGFSRGMYTTLSSRGRGRVVKGLKSQVRVLGKRDLATRRGVVR
jgi:hypothetical protein